MYITSRKNVIVTLERVGGSELGGRAMGSG